MRSASLLRLASETTVGHESALPEPSRPGDPDGASINDTPMSDPEDAGLSDEDIDMFEDDPTIPTE